MGLLRGRDYLSLDLCSFAGDKMMRRGFYMSTLKNGVLLRNRKAESRPLMEVICSLLLFAPCLSALMISCCEYFLINVKLIVWGSPKTSASGQRCRYGLRLYRIVYIVLCLCPSSLFQRPGVGRAH